MTEELIHDCISFRKFLDISDENTIPDETTICKFRNALIKADLLETVFNEVKRSMIEKSLILNEGTLVYATLVHASEPKRKRDNQRFAKVRAVVELPFAFIKRQMNYIETRYIGLYKNSQHAYLIAAAYNLKRIPNLIQRSA